MIVDYIKVLIFMFVDGVILFNVKVGYLVCLLIRKSIRYFCEFGFEILFVEIVVMYIKEFFLIFFEFKEMEDVIFDIINVEEKCYVEIFRCGSDFVKREIVKFKKKGINEFLLEKFILFYESYGLMLEIVVEVVEKEGIKVNILDNFYILVVKEVEK